MIYSRWDPVKGGYDYFESSRGDVAMGDDLPTPRLPQSSLIGVASLDAGRPMPSDAKYVGHGELAKGLITPVQRTALGAISSLVPMWAMWLSGGLALGWFLTKKRVL